MLMQLWFKFYFFFTQNNSALRVDERGQVLPLVLKIRYAISGSRLGVEVLRKGKDVYRSSR